MKRKNVDRDLVNFVMDWVTNKKVSPETIEVIYQKVGKRLTHLVDIEQRKLMRKLKQGDKVSFIDRKGFERKGEVVDKTNINHTTVVVKVDGVKQVWRVVPKFLKIEGR